MRNRGSTEFRTGPRRLGGMARIGLASTLLLAVACRSGDSSDGDQQPTGPFDGIEAPTPAPDSRCPEGGTPLASDTFVSADRYTTDTPDHMPQRAGSVVINGVMRYTGTNEEVIGWCGKSLGGETADAVDGRDKVVVLVPAATFVDEDDPRLVYETVEFTAAAVPAE